MNKEIIYEEYMPDTIARVNEVSRSEQVAEYMWANTDLKLRVIPVIWMSVKSL